jgi:ATP-dependent protease ClpP protease subunit
MTADEAVSYGLIDEVITTRDAVVSAEAVGAA